MAPDAGALGVALHAVLDTPLDAPVGFDRSEAPAIAFAALICFGSNYVLIGALVALHTGHSVIDFVRLNFWSAAGEEIAAYGFGASIAFAGVHANTLPLLLLPFALGVGGRKDAERAERGLHDLLTDLPNRLVFLDRAQQAIERSARDGVGGAILLIDLDGFKQVNDTLGHRAGDALLRDVGARLSGLVRSMDTVARLGGDEFGVLLVGVDAGDGVANVTRAVRHALDRPFLVGDGPRRVGGSVGVAIFTDDEHDVDALLHRADLRMYDDKRQRAAATRSAATSINTV